MRIHRARASFRLGDPVMPWVYAIARNTRVDQYRRQLTSLPQATGDGPEPFHDERAALENRMMAETVQQRLSELPDGQREVFLLLKVHGLSMDETARAVGISTSAAKQKAYRAYQRLRSLFGQAGSGQGKEGTSE